MDKDYWRKRQTDLEKLQTEKTNETIIKITKLYGLVFDELNTMIKTIFQTFLDKGGAGVDDPLALLNQKQTKEAREKLMELYDRTTDLEVRSMIWAQINAPAYAYRISRIEALRDLIKAEANVCGVEVENLTQARLIDVYADSYNRTTYNIQKATGYAYDFTKLSNPAVRQAIAHEWNGGNYSTRIWGNTKLLADRLEQIVTAGLMTGLNVKEMSKQLEKATNSGLYNTTRVVRTEVNYMCNQGIKESLEDAEIEKYIYIATLDTRTSTACRNLDGKIFPVAEAQAGKNFPPMHPHCRSVTGAYITGRDRSKLKRRARDKNGNSILVPQTMTYHEWYEKYISTQ